MAKLKTVYICQNCGTQSPKWLGRCNACGEWNTFVEEVVEANRGVKQAVLLDRKLKTQAVRISDLDDSEEERIDLKNAEFNRVLGGGLVCGSLVLLGGEPGIGKSTLALQVALGLITHKTLYISGEESVKQIKLRANRLGITNDNCFFLSETLLEEVVLHLNQFKPDIVVVDSIQTLYTEKIESSPGSVSQIRECTTELLRFAKTTSTPIILIGHITKEGTIAGPKVLEHVVDTVLQFEGEQYHQYRVLRAAKNRFGSTAELGIFQMQNDGLREVTNPSELLLSHTDEDYSGVAVSATVEGARAFLIEVQSLVSSAAYGTPQRSSTGFDLRRLSMLLAVLEKRVGFRLATKDVFLNIAGGIRVDDPAIDLSVICAILSSDLDTPIARSICFAGEVGLTGEIRPVNRVEQRISEAQKLGFKEIYISKYNRQGVELSKYPIQVHLVAKVEEVFKRIFRSSL